MAPRGISCYTEIVHLLDMLLVMQAGSDGTGAPLWGQPLCWVLFVLLPADTIDNKEAEQ